MRRRSSSGDLGKEIGAFGEMSLVVEKPRPVMLMLPGLSISSALRLPDNTKNWSDLPAELVTEILQRLHSYKDFVCATSSCSFWRLIGTNQFSDVFSGGGQFPLLMLAEESNTDLRGFYNVLNNKTRYLKLPEANGKKKCVSWRGWLVTLHPNLEMNVMHPLSRVQFKLPDISASVDLERYGFDPVYCYDGVLMKAVFSSSPGKKSEDYALSILTAVGEIALWRKGGASWIEIGRSGMDIVFYEGLFYGVDFWGKIFSWNMEGAGLQNATRFFPVPTTGIVEKWYLVESGGLLLLVAREIDAELIDYNDYGTYRFQVFKVRWCQSDTSDWTPIQDLGRRSLFLGFNSSFSIDASDFPGCKPNCIYFTDDFNEHYCEIPGPGGGKDTGIYYLEDGCFEHFPVKSFCCRTPPIWVELTSSGR